MRRTEDKREGQQSILVKDRAAEVGINLNTIFTALVLAGIVWVGTTLESIRDTLSKNAVAIALLTRDLNQLEKRVDEHMLDNHARGRR